MDIFYESFAAQIDERWDVSGVNRLRRVKENLLLFKLGSSHLEAKVIYLIVFCTCT